jgi:hypothetical protein
MWNIEPKGKCIHKNIHDHIHTYMQNMLVIAEILCGTWEKERKEKRIENQQSIYITSVQVEDMAICTESC